MNIDELYTILQEYNLRPSHRDLALLWGMDEASFSRKRKSKTDIKQKNIIQTEQHYNVRITKTLNNTGERQNDTTVKERVSHFGERLGNLQDQHEYLDKDMAKLLKISEEEYIELKLGDAEPDLEILNRLKQCFKISVDVLLYGD